MARPSNNTQRLDLRVPEELMLQIEQYQEDQQIRTRTAALFEILRIGLRTVKEKNN